jgi:hypothetical protein
MAFPKPSNTPRRRRAWMPDNLPPEILSISLTEQIGRLPHQIAPVAWLGRLALHSSCLVHIVGEHLEDRVLLSWFHHFFHEVAHVVEQVAAPVVQVVQAVTSDVVTIAKDVVQNPITAIEDAAIAVVAPEALPFAPLITITTNDIVSGDSVGAALSAGISSEVDSVTSDAAGSLIAAATGLPDTVGSIAGSVAVAAVTGSDPNSALVGSIASTIDGAAISPVVSDAAQEAGLSSGDTAASNPSQNSATPSSPAADAPVSSASQNLTEESDALNNLPAPATNSSSDPAQASTAPIDSNLSANPAASNAASTGTSTDAVPVTPATKDDEQGNGTNDTNATSTPDQMATAASTDQNSSTASDSVTSNSSTAAATPPPSSTTSNSGVASDGSPINIRFVATNSGLQIADSVSSVDTAQADQASTDGQADQTAASAPANPSTMAYDGSPINIQFIATSSGLVIANNDTATALTQLDPASAGSQPDQTTAATQATQTNPPAVADDNAQLQPTVTVAATQTSSPSTAASAQQLPSDNPAPVAPSPSPVSQTPADPLPQGQVIVSEAVAVKPSSLSNLSTTPAQVPSNSNLYIRGFEASAGTVFQLSFDAGMTAINGGKALIGFGSDAIQLTSGAVLDGYSQISGAPGADIAAAARDDIYSRIEPDVDKAANAIRSVANLSPDTFAQALDEVAAGVGSRYQNATMLFNSGQGFSAGQAAVSGLGVFIPLPIAELGGSSFIAEGSEVATMTAETAGVSTADSSAIIQSSGTPTLVENQSSGAKPAEDKLAANQEPLPPAIQIKFRDEITDTQSTETATAEASEATTAGESVETITADVWQLQGEFSTIGSPAELTTPNDSFTVPAYRPDANSTQQQVLYHYTDENGMNGIIESSELNASTKANNPNDVRYGNGQYMSDIIPGTKTSTQLSREFLGMPFQGQWFTHYVEVDVTGLEVIPGRNGVFVVPGDKPLDLTDRIIGHGNVPLSVK